MWIKIIPALQSSNDQRAHTQKQLDQSLAHNKDSIDSLLNPCSSLWHTEKQPSTAVLRFDTLLHSAT